MATASTYQASIGEISQDPADDFAGTANVSREIGMGFVQDGFTRLQTTAKLLCKPDIEALEGNLFDDRYYTRQPVR